MNKITAFYKALGDETRLKILEMLSEREMCVCEIIDRLELTQPAISHHLKILRQAGLVTDSREGKWIYYTLNDGVFQEVFPGETGEVILSYAEPIKRQMQKQKASRIRTEPSLCEKLTRRQKNAE